MPKAPVNALKITVSVSLAILILYLVFKNVEWEKFWGQTKDVDYQWILYSIGLSIFSYLLRAYRWNILLEPLGYKLKTSRTTVAVLIGYLANLAIPRLGEITRCGILKQNDHVPVNVALGSVVTERIIDLVMLFGLLIVGLGLERNRLLTLLEQSYSGLEISASYLWIAAVVVMLLSFLIYYFLRKKKWNNKISLIVTGFLTGVFSLRQIKRPFRFMLSTLALWIVYYFMSYIIVYTLPATAQLDLTAGLMLLITGGIALALPVQSGFGTYHGLISGMLALYSVEKTTGLFLATLLHTSQIIAIAIFGGMGLIISFFIRRQAINENIGRENQGIGES